ncbi:MFS transporter [Micromonospora sp. DSM 115977]|uniref:MFS transporter n=1 Tax=Micromonospora reichwaldensis TaxID=3075516 RepID=A0ABU2X4L8_9ACTN|nr:MFS transporter [Micromonospora sp. DSM 115977]MDT0532703.1 MFS transporter [Micromonospora sp. DSM 115977]
MTTTGGKLSFYRPIVPLFAAIFLCLLGVGASLAVLPFYVLDELGGNRVEVGVVIAAIAVSAVIARPIAGRIGDRHGYRTVMLGGAVVCAAAGAAYLVAGNVGVLVGVRVLHGIGEAAVYTAGAAWLVALAPADRRGRVVGLYGIYMWLGITLGALLGAVLLRTSGYPAVWLFAVLAAAVGAALVAARPRPQQASPAGRAGILPRSAVAPGVALSLAGFGYAALAAFVALHMAERGVENGIVAFNAFGFTYVGVRLVVGGLPDKLGAGRVAVGSALVEAVGLLLVAVAPNLLVAVLGGLVIGAGLSLLFPALALLVINRADPAHQGTALGAFTSFWDIGLVAGAPLAGLVASMAGYPAVFQVMLLAALLSAALSAWTMLPRRSPLNQHAG